MFGYTPVRVGSRLSPLEFDGLLRNPSIVAPAWGRQDPRALPDALGLAHGIRERQARHREGRGYRL